MVAPTPGLGILQSASVTPRTLRAYSGHHQRYQLWLARHVLRPCTEAEHDEALSRHLDELYLDGEGSATGQKVFASVLFYEPSLAGRSGAKMPRARASLKGWKKLAPPTSRLPLPFEVMAGIVNAMWAAGETQEALWVWLSFELYLRPSEAGGIRAVDFVPPVAGREAHKAYSVTLNASERRQPSKTGEYDDSARLDLPRHAPLAAALARMLDRRLGQHWRRVGHGGAAHDMLFTVPAEAVREAFRRAGERVGVSQHLGPLHMYMLRHGGASHDYGSGARRLDEVRLRGRWRSWGSLRRYQKGGRLGQQLHRLPPDVLDHVNCCADSLGAVVSGRRTPVVQSPGAK